MRTRLTLGAALAALGLLLALPVSSAGANSGHVHCLRYGETVSGVAAAYGTTVWAIAYANGIPNPNHVRAGACLRIPAGHGGYGHGGYGQGGYKPAHGGYSQVGYKKGGAYGHGGYGQGVYCVRYGDTLSGIAARYGSSAWAIAHANGLPNPNCIAAGMCLTIPGY
jgi:LysM repeat protein